MAAAVGQATLVYFLSDGHRDSLHRSRPIGERLAAVTGARVLTVACPVGCAGYPAAVEAGLTAFTWLLGEGCDVGLTAFVTDHSNDELVVDILIAAANRGLPIPCVVDPMRA